MDLDNLGPIVLFIVYMAISAWSKQKKARQRVKPAEKSRTAPISKPLQGVGGILDQLKKELFEIDEEPLTFQQVTPENEPEEEDEEEVIPVSAVDMTPRFAEGSQKQPHSHPLIKVVESVKSNAGQTLEEVLEPYSKLEQGIILHEIMGKPRAYQKNEEWFHRS